MRTKVLELQLQDCTPPASEEPRGKFRIDVIGHRLGGTDEEARELLRAVSGLVVGCLGQRSLSVSLGKPFFTASGARLGVRGWADADVFKELDGLFPLREEFSVPAAEGRQWTATIRWEQRRLPHQLLLVGVPPTCTPASLQRGLVKAGLPVSACAVASSAIAETPGTGNFSAYVVEVEAREEELPREIRMQSGASSIAVRVDRYVVRKKVIRTHPECVREPGSWAAVVAGDALAPRPVVQPPPSSNTSRGSSRSSSSSSSSGGRRRSSSSSGGGSRKRSISRSGGRSGSDAGGSTPPSPGSSSAGTVSNPGAVADAPEPEAVSAVGRQSRGALRALPAAPRVGTAASGGATCCSPSPGQWKKVARRSSARVASRQQEQQSTPRRPAAGRGRLR